MVCLYRFPPPTVPKDFVPMHRFAADTVSAATQGNWTQDGDGNWIQQKATQKSLRQTNMSTADRGRLLGEPATSAKVAHRS